MQRVGVDIGGTFTDLVVYDEETGEVSKTKTLTTPREPEIGLLRACQDTGLKLEEVSYFLHATTLVTNLIIQRAGADVGLITTRGFRHVLEFGDGRKGHTYSLQWERPRPFAPTHLVAEVDERIDHRGRVLKPLDRASVVAAVRALVAKGVPSIAVALFNSYVNGEHERQVEEIIRELAPQVYVSLSSEVDPRIREYQRTSTTAINAYAMPRVYGYVERLDKALNVRKGINYMHSGGGIIPSSVAKRFPVMLVESGPAAGVLAGKFLGEKLGIKNIITGDVGGTSYDVCVIRNGVPEIKDTLEVEPTIPLRTDSIDVVSIGAGGGSIAWIDEGGALKVGPRSAGSDPGPACYNLGGMEPTSTDANMVLGILNPENLLGGKLKVDPQRSWGVIRPLAAHFQVDAVEAALGVYRLATANMAQAIRQITVHKGIDPREFTLISFGGAGGQYAVNVARELEMRWVLFPANASVLSAFGLLTADLRFTATKSLWMPLSQVEPPTLEEHFQELQAKAVALLRREGTDIVRIGVERSADVRYVGQSWDVRVPLGDGVVSREDIHAAFERAYMDRYGLVLGDPVEITNLHVTATGYIRPLELSATPAAPTDEAPKPKGYRKVAFFDREIPVYDRADLAYGMTIDHACIIEEADTTILILEGCMAEVDRYGNIRATIVAAAESGTRTLDPFTAEIIRSYLNSTVQEMVKTTTGAAYSTCFSEGGDFTCAMFDAQGRLVAQALGVPIHAGSIFDAVKSIVRTFDTFEEGDVVVMNDPYDGGSHQSDAVILRPVFLEGRLIAFAANRGHWTDIGGMAAGGWSGTATHVVQEALTIPPVKLYRAGVLDRQIRSFILKNVRLSKQLWGDIQSQIASLIAAERRLKYLVEKYGLDLVLEGMESALDYSRKHLQTMLAEVPDGVGYAEDLLDDDGFSIDRHYKVCVRVEKRGDRLVVDCAGTDPQALGPINMSVASSKGATFAAVLSLIDPFLPLTEAILDLVEVRLPEGTLVNPYYPAPVAAFYCVMTRVSESLVRAMAALRPDLVVAGSYGDLQNTTGWGYHPETGEEFIWYLFHCGGCGGRATKDGLTGTRHMLANSRSESMEVWEKRYPVFYERLEVSRDSAGPGKYRGGLGMLRIFRLLSDTFVTMNSDRNVIPAPGVFGGQPGMTNRLTVIRDGVERTVDEMFDLPSPSKFTNIFLRKGDLLAFRLGGGGGYGDRLEREIHKVEWDVLNDWVSVERARDDYGVVVDSATGKADIQRTADLRGRLRKEGQIGSFTGVTGGR